MADVTPAEDSKNNNCVQKDSGAADLEETSSKVNDSEPTKESFRQKVWNHLEKNRLSDFPRPSYGRIPNFKGAKDAAAKLLELDEFQSAKYIEVNPDKPLEYSRVLVLDNNKELYVPVPRLKEGLLKKLEKDGTNETRKIASRWGMENTGKEVDINDEIRIDLLVVGSVAVSKDGYRIGKGKGYADLEFAILKDMKAIDDNTVIVTTVHDCQVFDELPKELFKKHDIPVDYILTPTQIIKVENRLPRPQGIFWDILSQRRLKQMAPLRKLMEKHVKEGREITLEAADSDEENTRPKNRFRRFVRRRRTRVRDQNSDEQNVSPANKVVRKTRYFRRKRSTSSKNDPASTEEQKTEKVQPKKQQPYRYRRKPTDFSLMVSNIERNVRVKDLKSVLIEKGVRPYSITWKGYKGVCYLHYAKPDAKKEEESTENSKDCSADSIIEVLQDLKLNPESSCGLSVKVMEQRVTRIETTDVTAV